MLRKSQPVCVCVPWDVCGGEVPVMAPSRGFAMGGFLSDFTSDVELFCTKAKPVTVAASANGIYLSSDNAIYLSFSPLH